MESIDKYYRVVKNVGNKLITNTNNIDKYHKLMTNYCSSWYNMGEYCPDFNDESFINNFFILFFSFFLLNLKIYFIPKFF